MNSHSEACQVPERDDLTEQLESLKEAIAEAQELLAEFAIRDYMDAQRLEWELIEKGIDPSSACRRPNQET